MHQQNRLYKEVKFVNLSKSAFGIYDTCTTGQSRRVNMNGIVFE